MPTPATTFTMPADRGAQLRQIAKRNRITVREQVTRWIDRDLHALGLHINTAVINIKIEQSGGEEVTFTVELFGQHAIRLNPTQAGDFAKTIEGVIRAGGITMNMDADMVVVTKRGTGIVIEHQGFRRSMPVYEAQQIANELKDAAAEYAVK